MIYASGFGPTSTPVVSGSTLQSGSLSPLPVINIGGIAATVRFAGLVAPGEFQFNVDVPSSLTNGDQPVTGRNTAHRASVVGAGGVELGVVARRDTGLGPKTWRKAQIPRPGTTIGSPLAVLC